MIKKKKNINNHNRDVDDFHLIIMNLLNSFLQVDDTLRFFFFGYFFRFRFGQSESPHGMTDM